MFAQYWWHMRSFYSHFRENTNSKYHKGIQYDICDTFAHQAEHRDFHFSNSLEYFFKSNTQCYHRIEPRSPTLKKC